MSQPMNREQRRMLKRQGQEVNEAGEVVQKTAPKKGSDSGGAGSGGRVTKTGGAGDGDGGGRRRREAPVQVEERTKPLQFLREVRTELRKVNWPTRSEVLNYSLVVFFTVVVLTVMIGLLDWLFSVSILELFKP